MTLQEYEQQGGCAGCAFYGAINIEGIQGCTFNWDDDESDDFRIGGEIAKKLANRRRACQN